MRGLTNNDFFISDITDRSMIIRMKPLVPLAAQFGIDKKGDALAHEVDGWDRFQGFVNATMVSNWGRTGLFSQWASVSELGSPGPGSWSNIPYSFAEWVLETTGRFQEGLWSEDIGQGKWVFYPEILRHVDTLMASRWGDDVFYVSDSDGSGTLGGEDSRLRIMDELLETCKPIADGKATLSLPRHVVPRSSEQYDFGASFPSIWKKIMRRFRYMNERNVLLFYIDGLELEGDGSGRSRNSRMLLTKRRNEERGDLEDDQEAKKVLEEEDREYVVQEEFWDSFVEERPAENVDNEEEDDDDEDDGHDEDAGEEDGNVAPDSESEPDFQ